MANIEPSTGQVLLHKHKEGVSKALDNLASVAINTSLISDTDSTDDLGSSSKYWANGYVDKIYSGDTGEKPNPHTFPVATPISVDDMNTGWSDEHSSGTVAHDTTFYFEGVGSVKIITSTDNALCGMSKSGTFDFSSNDFRLMVYSDDWAKVDVARITFLTSVGNYYTINLNIIFQDLKNSEWYDLQLCKGKFVATGTPSWATITKVIVESNSPSGQTGNVWFDGLTVYPVGKRGVVSVCFDDGWSTGYTIGAKYMEKYGMVGNDFVIPSKVGTGVYMTQANIDDLAKKGWEIGGHGETDLTTLTAEQVETDVRVSAAYLNARNYAGSSVYAYPNGQDNNSVRSIVGRYFSYARTINYINQPLLNVSPLRLNCLAPIGSWTTANVTKYIDDAINNNEWLILTFHLLATSSSGSTEFVTSRFQEIIDYLVTNDVTVLPISRVLAQEWEIVNAATAEKLTTARTINGISFDGSAAINIVEAVDHGTAATDQLVNVSYGTGAAPSANTTTEGSLYITYTA